MFLFNPLEAYQGPLPLFPLPNVVFFPNTFLPLHIFEPRYHQMVKDTLETDGLIGMALLKPGFRDQYQESPPIYEMVCLGQIVRAEVLPENKYNIILHGLKRARVKHIHVEKPYRKAKVEVVEEAFKPLSIRKQAHLRDQLFEAFSRVIEPPHWGFTVFSAPHLDLGVLSDLITSSFPCDPVEKQRILETIRPEDRVHELIKILEGEEGRGRRLRVKQLPFLYELARS